MKEIIGIPGEYFLKMARSDYANFYYALPREFYQNSIDAGASFIRVSYNPDQNSISIEDDGCGMTEEILRNKLLVLGGSHKGQDAVGTFGKAKELLYFSWERYKIETGPLEVEGAGALFSISCKRLQNTRPTGTKSTIWLPGIEPPERVMDGFRSVAEKTETRTEIFIDGELISPALQIREEIRSIPNIGILYKSDAAFSQNLTVRIRGTWMMDSYLGDIQYPQALILELDPNIGSDTLLTSNRDWFKWPASTVIQETLEQIRVNPRSFLKPPVEMESVILPGKAGVCLSLSPEEEENALRWMRDLLHQMDGLEDQPITEEERQKAVGVLLGVPVSSHILKMRMNQIASSLLATGILKDVRDMLSWVSYQPNFMVQVEKGTFEERNISRVVGAHKILKKGGKLALLWTEIIRQVLLCAKVFVPFTPGFTFDKDKEAIYWKENGIHFFGLNPRNKKLSPRPLLVEELKDLAIHEVVHIKHKLHNEEFVAEEFRIRAACRPYASLFQKIGRTVK